MDKFCSSFSLLLHVENSYPHNANHDHEQEQDFVILIVKMMIRDALLENGHKWTSSVVPIALSPPASKYT